MMIEPPLIRNTGRLNFKMKDCDIIFRVSTIWGMFQELAGRMHATYMWSVYVESEIRSLIDLLSSAIHSK